MKYKIFKLLLILILSLVTSSLAQEINDTELAERVKLAFEKREKVRFQDDLAIKTLREELQDLSDSEKIRGITYILLEREKKSKRKMDFHIFSNLARPSAQIINNITDYSELRNILRNEENPRKFYILSCLKPHYTIKRLDFIPETFHMLFKDGRVHNLDSEYTFDHSHDVSLYAYESILKTLDLNGYRVQIPQSLTHDQDVVILARWLKQNWPGCENLVIPDKFLKMNVPEVKKPVKYVKPKSPIQPRNEALKEKDTNHVEKAKSPYKLKSNPKENSENSIEIQSNKNSDSKNQNSSRVWLVLGSLLSVILISMWVIKRKS